MPMANLKPFGRCEEVASIKALNDHLIVLTAKGHRKTYVIPLTSLPFQTAAAAATLTILRRYRQAFFLGDHTLILLRWGFIRQRLFSLTRITAKEPEFRQTVTEEIDHIPVLGGWRLDRHYGFRPRLLSPSDQSCRRLLCYLTPKNARPPTEARHHAIITITATSVECAEILPVTNTVNLELDSPVRWTLHNRSLYLRTALGEMWWKDYIGDQVHIVGARYVITADENNVVSIYDAADRSESLSLVLPGTLSPDFRLDPSIAISSSGHGMMVLANTLYKFDTSAFVQPLEMLAAVTTWNQLSDDKRDALNSIGPHDFQTFVRHCYEEPPQSN